MPALQTGVCSQPEDRCTCVIYVSRPRAGMFVPFLHAGPRPFAQCSQGGERSCLPGEDLAGQALSVKPGSRWASLGRVVACLRVVRPGFAAGPLRQARVVPYSAFQTWNSLGAYCWQA